MAEFDARERSAEDDGRVRSAEDDERNLQRPTRRRVLTYAAGIGVLGMAGVAGALAAGRSRPAVGGERRPPMTTTIQRGDLVETVTVNGRLGYGPETQLVSRLEGTLTAVPPIGAVIMRGGELFRVDDRPVILLYGQIPAYRDIGPHEPALTGRDVRQLEENLNALGYKGFAVGSLYTDASAAAVKKWQQDLGLESTGTVELGRVQYATGPVRIATHGVVVGAPATGSVLSYTGTVRLVTATIKAYQQDLAHVGAKVDVELATGTTLPATVLTVEPPPADQGQAGDPVLSVVIGLSGTTGLDQAADGTARVHLPGQRRDNVLHVSVAALLSLAEGGYGVEAVEGDRTRVVAVTPGLFANGDVEVSGPGIEAGMTVVTAQ